MHLTLNAFNTNKISIGISENVESALSKFHYLFLSVAFLLVRVIYYDVLLQNFKINILFSRFDSEFINKIGYFNIFLFLIILRTFQVLMSCTSENGMYAK